MAETNRTITPNELSELNACVDAGVKMADFIYKMFVLELQMILNAPTSGQDASVVLSKTHAAIRDLIKKYNH